MAPGRCVWGFKVFDNQLTNRTFFDWLWSRLDTALVLQRDNGAQTHSPPLRALSVTAMSLFKQSQRNLSPCNGPTRAIAGQLGIVQRLESRWVKMILQHTAPVPTHGTRSSASVLHSSAEVRRW